MWHFIFETLWGWWGVAGLVVVGCVVVGYFIPSLRLAALAVGGVFISGATIFSKGYAARAKLEAARKEEAVRKAREDYDKIDKRNDTPDTVSKRLGDGTF